MKIKRYLAVALSAMIIANSVVPSFAAENGIGDEIQVEEFECITDVELPENDELFEGYAEQLFYGTEGIETFSVGDQSAGASLSGNDEIAYETLVPVIKDIAAGNRASTVIAIGKSFTSGGVAYNADIQVQFETGNKDFNIQSLVDALLMDYPYEMYWYNKTVKSSAKIVSSGGSILQIIFTLYVSENYQADDNTTVNVANAALTKNAAEYAKSIVEENEEKSDYEKLLAYKEEICSLVDYDHAAADTGNFAINNDPWQLIHVFDQDASTNVVCEGYAKAFQYLCDMTSFETDVSCYCVTGVMTSSTGGGEHMWNIVTLDDKNYLVDVTNCDQGTIGYPDELFLCGTESGSVTEGYTFSVKSKDILFEYDERISTVWGTDVLTLSDSNYKVTEENPENDTNKEEDVIASGECQNYSWIIYNDGLLYVEGKNGANAINDMVREQAPWYEYRNSIKALTIKNIYDIGNYAFYGLEKLETADITDGRPDIGNFAFSECFSLGKIYIAGSYSGSVIGESAFSYCTSLEEVSIPYNTDIGANAFTGCTGLKSLYINSISGPYGYTACVVAEDSFSGIKATVYHPLETNANQFGNNSFGGVFTCKEVNYGTCGPNAMWQFDENNHLLTISGEGKVVCAETGTWAPWSRFSDDIESIVIEEGITEITEYFFEYNQNLSSVSLPNTIKIVHYNAFNECQNLRKIIIPVSVKEFQSVESGRTSDAFTNTYYLGSEEEWASVKNSELITNKGHNIHFLSYVKQVDATCAQDGTEAYYGFGKDTDYPCYYDAEKNRLDTPVVIPATGHKYEWIVDKEATCKEAGSKYQKCTICGYSVTGEVIEIPKLSHTYGGWEIDKEASCTEEGSKHQKCTGCEDTVTEKIPVTDHNWKSIYTVDKEASCTEKGSKSIHCANCSATKEVTEIPKLSHVYGEWEIDKEASCTEEGSKHQKCTGCEDTVTEKIPVTDHSWKNSYTVDKETSCKEAGSKSIHCEKCTARKDITAIPALKHTEVIDKAVAPTSTTTGLTEGIHCSVCDEVIQEQTVIEALGNNNPFKDVEEGRFFYDPVLWAVKNNITTGTKPDKFSPDDPCTRAQVVTFLWRAIDRPKATNKSAFTDLREGAYYLDAVDWAVEANITTGTKPDKFSPDDPCTRAQIVTFLWRVAGCPKPSGENNFEDLREGAYYLDAVSWAVEEGITVGTSPTKFSPDEKCTRAQVVTFLYRYIY